MTNSASNITVTYDEHGVMTTSGDLRMKIMAPGHFCPDVVDLSDFGDADYLRGRVVRGFMWAMEWWPKAGPRTGRWRDVFATGLKILVIGFAVSIVAFLIACLGVFLALVSRDRDEER